MSMPVVVNPFTPRGTELNFYIPPTVLSDFQKFTHTDVPNTNFTFEILSDWYAKDLPDYEPRYIRGEMYPINWKSKMGNSDQSMNFKAGYEQRLRKGDILLREDGEIFIINWRIQEYINAQNSQINISNLPLEVYRNVPKEMDSMGYVTAPARKVIIAPTIPTIWKVYIGRPEYQVLASMPGIVSTDIIEIYVQYNSYTKNIRIDDLFKVEQYEYRVVEVQYSELDYHREYGLIYLQGKRNAGGETAIVAP